MMNTWSTFIGRIYTKVDANLRSRQIIITSKNLNFGFIGLNILLNELNQFTQ